MLTKNNQFGQKTCRRVQKNESKIPRKLKEVFYLFIQRKIIKNERKNDRVVKIKTSIVFSNIIQINQEN